MRLFALVACCAAAGGAQTPPAKIPVRELAPIAARTPQAFGQIGSVHELARGRVLVSDSHGDRLLVYDSTLRSFTVLADTNPSTPVQYSRGGATIVPYRGDSLLFLDIPSRSFIVINPDGTAGRAVAPPKATDISAFSRYRTGIGVDARGGLVYRGIEPPQGRSGPRPDPNDALAGRRGAPRAAANADSASVVRGDFERRTVDTIARIKVPHVGFASTVRDPATGNLAVTEFVSPVAQPFDEWTVTSDGAVAIVRAHDYHVDWILPDGTTKSTPPMAYDLRRLTDDDKRRKLDSAQTIIDSVRAAGGYKTRMCSGNTGVCSTIERTVHLVPVTDVPDYVPPFRTGAVQADRDGNVWIVPTTTAQSIAGELVYDVINRAGGLFERVRIPKGKAVAGFGRDGVIYLISGDAKNGFHLERTRIQ